MLFLTRGISSWQPVMSTIRNYKELQVENDNGKPDYSRLGDRVKYGAII